MHGHRISIKFFLFSLFISSITFLNGQDTIYLNNPSFEDMPRKGVSGMPFIKGWTDCALSRFTGESPPDIHPVKDNAWGVAIKPMDGQTFLGMVTRYNFSWESVGQNLSRELRSGTCYSFSVFLASYGSFTSPTRRSIKQHGSYSSERFIQPITLVVWGGINSCDRTEVLATTDPVDHQDWRKYDFILNPTRDYSYITIEAYYSIADTDPYNGNILVDGLSPIIEIPCD
jgi:hypothetical protein